MKKIYLILALFIGFLLSLSIRTFAQSGPKMQIVDKIDGLVADVKIGYPVLGIKSIDKAVIAYTNREISQFKQQSALNLGNSGNEKNILWIDCKVVTNTQMYYSVLCDQKSFVQGARGQSVQTFNYNKKSRTSIRLSNLIPSYKLEFLSSNLRRYFINALQATEQEQIEWIKNGLTAQYADYSDFTLVSNGSGIQGIYLYFDPFKISGLEQGTQWVKLTYPGLKIMK